MTIKYSKKVLEFAERAGKTDGSFDGRDNAKFGGNFGSLRKLDEFENVYIRAYTYWYKKVQEQR